VSQEEHRVYTKVVENGKWLKAGAQHMRLNKQRKSQNLTALLVKAKKVGDKKLE
jgi:hypothetical protein